MRIIFLFLIFMLQPAIAKTCINQISEETLNLVESLNSTELYMNDMYNFYELDTQQRKLFFAKIKPSDKLSLWQFHIQNITQSYELNGDSLKTVEDIL